MPYQHVILQSKYFYLSSLLIAFFLLNPFLGDDRVSNLILLTVFSLMMLFSIYVISERKLLTFFTVTAAIFSYFSYYYIIWLHPTEVAYTVHFVFTFIFLGLITYSIIYSVVMQKEISADTLFGAVCGYLLIGLTWTYIYLFIATMDHAAFSIHIDHETARMRIDHFIYYSFVTLTTTGYGDILALKSVPRTFSWLEAVVGQVYLAVWISQLVGLRILQKQKLS